MAHKTLQTNFDVDYVISYRMPKDEGKEAGITQFRKLIRALAETGLTTEVRRGDETSLLVFIKASDEKILADVVHRSRIKDWLHGVRQIQPSNDVANILTSEPLTDAERLRHIHHMICCPREEGGAGITPKHGEWKNVEAVFPLHDHVKNKKWLTEFTRKTFLTPDDLDEIRNTVGEKIAYYYAFLQSYFSFMIFPAAFGFSCWVLLGNFSPIYAIVNGLWCVVFVEYWKRQEQELAIRWNVKNVSLIEDKRREFAPEKVTTDPVTGEQIWFFPAKKRLQRQLLQLPLAALCVVGLGAIICTCYAIEIFISEVYDGPLKSILVFLPTILLTLAVPTMSNFLTGFAEKLTYYENYETQDAHDKAMVSKVFVINFITSYTAIFLTSFVYVPFASILVPYLDVFSMTVRPFAENEKQLQTPSPATFSINPNRLRNQMIYFAVTAQVVNFAMETVMPVVTQRGTKKFKEMQSQRAEKHGGATPSVADHDPPEEKEFLARVREEAALPDYDVTSDLREMCIQFGYLSCFSVIWPLTPVSYFINNWIELRGDTFKLAVECRRPNPARADSIGPWLDSLEFLAWLGSITSAALVYMFSGGDGHGPDGRPHQIKLWALLLSVFLSEHIFLVVRVLVRTAISKLDSAAMRKERSERFMVRRKYLEDAGLGHAVKPIASPPNSPLKTESGEQAFASITRQSLEEDARNQSTSTSGGVEGATERFWLRQRSWAESERVGLGMIELMDLGTEKAKKAQ
ncbi:plasma membrane stress response protein [Cladophialophora carrionii]|uniref:Plasma membrane stress response protein n=1 Tax=Cladophialophora carrionii TaxID=86049 RepID=A0A1C1CRZ0_9EURO|nr:plasma membrane stress response protein [Cladophialophora carrionii]